MLQELLAAQLIQSFADIFSESSLPLYLRPYEVCLPYMLLTSIRSPSVSSSFPVMCLSGGVLCLYLCLFLYTNNLISLPACCPKGCMHGRSVHDPEPTHSAVSAQSLAGCCVLWRGLRKDLSPQPSGGAQVLVTSNRTALIELVPDALSIHTIKAKSTPPGASLSEHFFARFGRAGPGCEAAQRAFAESMAGYSLVCYLLQIKVQALSL